MLNLLFTALGGYTSYRLWNINRAFAITTIVISILHYMSGRYMTGEAGGNVDVYFNILLTAYVIVAFALSFVL